MLHEKGGEVYTIVVGRVLIWKGSVVWSKSCVEISQDCHEVVCWDISDDCCKVIKEFLHLLRLSHVGGRVHNYGCRYCVA